MRQKTVKDGDFIVITTRITPELMRQMKHLAADERTTLQSLLQEAVVMLLSSRKAASHGG